MNITEIYAWTYRPLEFPFMGGNAVISIFSTDSSIILGKDIMLLLLEINFED